MLCGPFPKCKKAEVGGWVLCAFLVTSKKLLIMLPTPCILIIIMRVVNVPKPRTLGIPLTVSLLVVCEYSNAIR